MGRCSHIDSTAFQQAFIYDTVGNLDSTYIQDPIGSYDPSFSYDDLNQIIQETGLFENQYAFDSLKNRRIKNEATYSIDALNQLTDDSTDDYTYDPCGRRISKGSEQYSYDALGRLTQFSHENGWVEYQYDSFGRRIERKDSDGTTQYLYQFDTEIGAYENGALKEFKAIYGKFAAFAIELDGDVYSPIRNQRGDICALLDNQGLPKATYRYDAFGLFTQHGDVKSPWLFSGQRYDETTNLYHFNKREYDPTTGRWLTPDPLGFADGPNLYAYVKNNPFRYFDLDGCTAYEFAEGAGSTLAVTVGAGLVVRAAITGAGAVCPPLGATLAIGLTAYTAGSAIYNHWDSIQHYCSTFWNKGYKAGFAEIDKGISRAMKNFEQFSDSEKGGHAIQATILLLGGRRDLKSVASKTNPKNNHTECIVNDLPTNSKKPKYH